MKKVLEKASKVIGSRQDEIRRRIHHRNSEVSFYGKSIHKLRNAIIAMARDHAERFIMVISIREDGVIAQFSGEQIGDAGVCARKCPLNSANAEVLREIFPWTAPVSLRKKKTTIGCGDRLGAASPGHIAAVEKYNVFPVLAQQSMRELKQTGRSFRDVVDDATFLAFQSGYQKGFGADADHLKTIGNINLALAAGMPMVTLDLSDVLRSEAGNWTDEEILASYKRITLDIRGRLERSYLNKTFAAGKSEIFFDAPTLQRCAVMYLKAINYATKIHEHLKNCRGRDFDLEISLDETLTPSYPEHHYFIARELKRRKVHFTSLAPKFVGEFERAVDYRGSVKEFEKQFAVHADIARELGDYKISIHTGSDKFKIYPIIGSMTKMHFHLKTAGTSWLEAVKVIAETDPVLYKVMYKCAVKNYREAAKSYGLKARVKSIPDLKGLYEEDFPNLLSENEVRKMFHITYGPILNDSSIGDMIHAAMHENEEIYHKRIMMHFVKHLNKLGVPKCK